MKTTVGFLRGLRVFFLLVTGAICAADEHAHHDHGQPPVERPRVFLDKSPRVVEYQLKRLDNQRLLLVERDTTDPKYAPVYAAILSRPGMARQNRDEALAALTTLQSKSAVEVLLESLAAQPDSPPAGTPVVMPLTQMLLEQPSADLSAAGDVLASAARSSAAGVRTAAMAALLRIGQADQARAAADSPPGRAAFMAAIALLPDPAQRNQRRADVLRELDASDASGVRNQAVRTLGTLTELADDSFERLAGLILTPELRVSSIRALLQLHSGVHRPETARIIVSQLTDIAEQTPSAERTSDEFIDAMQLVDGLLPQLMPEETRQFRERLRAVTVRVVRVRTILEEMRYDTPWFAVEAGRPVQIVIRNEDLMPHNLVITRPGQLQQVAEAGAALGPNPGYKGLLYVPESDDVLFATGMVDTGRTERLTFDAPTEPGEYPFVCTFPRHWMRMYGVMVVVPDLDAWMRSPAIPADPLGNTRPLIRSWTISDFATEDLAAAVAQRPENAGESLFREATCLQCHKVHDVGGAVGPELTDVLTRWKNDHRGILREMLEPSWRIDPKYAVQVVVLKDGRTVSGILKAEDDQSLSLLVNPEAKEPTVVQRKDIEEIIPSATSMMPKALLDKFTHDEILDILAWITRAKSEHH